MQMYSNNTVKISSLELKGQSRSFLARNEVLASPFPIVEELTIKLKFLMNFVNFATCY